MIKIYKKKKKDKKYLSQKKLKATYMFKIFFFLFLFHLKLMYINFIFFFNQDIPSLSNFHPRESQLISIGKYIYAKKNELPHHDVAVFFTP